MQRTILQHIFLICYYLNMNVCCLYDTKCKVKYGVGINVAPQYISVLIQMSPKACIQSLLTFCMDFNLLFYYILNLFRQTGFYLGTVLVWLLVFLQHLRNLASFEKNRFAEKHAHISQSKF